MWLVFSFAIGLSLAVVSAVVLKLSGTQPIQSWQTNGSTVRLYRGNSILHTSPFIELQHERVLKLRFLVVRRTIDTFDQAKDARCQIDSTGLLHVYVPPIASSPEHPSGPGTQSGHPKHRTDHPPLTERLKERFYVVTEPREATYQLKPWVCWDTAPTVKIIFSPRPCE
jgi:hypothetical protein